MVRDLDLLIDFESVKAAWSILYYNFFPVMSEQEVKQEMPSVAGGGREVLGKLAELNKQAKDIQRTSSRIRETREKEKIGFVEEIDFGSSDSIEEVVPRPQVSL